MRIVHLYPFVPAGRHGGTLRLHAALAGSARVGEPELHFFDAGAGAWHGPAELDLGAAAAHPPAAEPGLKRKLFPSTLWESGRRARDAARGYLAGLGLEGAPVVFLHTTYLAPLLAALPAPPRRALVDAYDLVWRAHANDALTGPLPLRGVRAAYAATVRPRESRALARADVAIAAGAQDYELLRAGHPAARWIPTPTPVEPVAPRVTENGPLRIGMLGNFAHRSTRAGAELLLASELASAPGVEVVLAGLGSAAFAGSARVEVLGELERAESFYAEVDCVVAPVVGGSGMKVKLAEAVLAGRPVVTTRLGAAGYPSTISRHFTLADPGALDLPLARRAIDRFDRVGGRDALERELGWDAVLDRYAASLG
jgi:hypothetical protein